MDLALLASGAASAADPTSVACKIESVTDQASVECEAASVAVEKRRRWLLAWIQRRWQAGHHLRVGGKRDGVHGGSGIGGMRGGIAGVRGNVSGGRGDVNGRSHNISSIICVGGGRDSVGYHSRRGW
uniref:Uncharacterized protein n=1 Tax=Oryza barthii TaxID=65489 RepID=A0A0D3GES0_9ORYZ